MITVGHLLHPLESEAQTSCIVLRAMNKCHWEHAWEGRGTPRRGSADSFSFQTLCCHRGIEDKDPRRPLVVMKILIRAEALMHFIGEGDVSLQDILSHHWVDKKCCICLVKLFLYIPAVLWCNFPALVASLAQNHHHYCLGRRDFLQEW